MQGRMWDTIRGVKEKLGPLWWYGLLMLGFSQIGNLVNMYIGIVLVPDRISGENLGAVLPLTYVAGFVGIPLSIMVSASLKFVSVFHNAGEHGKVKRLLRDLVVLTSLLSVLILCNLWWKRDFFQARLKFQDPWIIWLVALLALTACWMPMVQMVVQGLKRFYSLIISRILGPVVRLVVILLVLEVFQVRGYLAASFASTLVIMAFLGIGLRKYMGRGIQGESYRDHLPEIWRYVLPVGLMMLALGLQRAVEPWVIRHRLSSADSAGYYFAAVFGMIPLYLSGAVVPFLFPLASDKFEKGESTRRMHLQVLAAVLGIGVLVALLFVLFGEALLGLRSAWQPYAAYGRYIWLVAVITTLDATANCHFTHELACRRFRCLRYCVPIAIVGSLLLYALMGWSFFRPWLPNGVWSGVASVVKPDLQFILGYMLAVRILIGACVVVDVAVVHKNG